MRNEHYFDKDLTRDLTFDGDVYIEGNVLSGKNITINGNGNLWIDGNINSKTTIVVNNGSIKVSGNVCSNSSIQILNNGDLTIDGNISSGTKIVVTKGSFVVLGIISSGSDITVSGVKFTGNHNQNILQQVKSIVNDSELTGRAFEFYGDPTKFIATDIAAYEIEKYHNHIIITSDDRSTLLLKKNGGYANIDGCTFNYKNGQLKVTNAQNQNHTYDLNNWSTIPKSNVNNTGDSISGTDVNVGNNSTYIVNNATIGHTMVSQNFADNQFESICFGISINNIKDFLKAGTTNYQMFGALLLVSNTILSMAGFKNSGFKTFGTLAFSCLTNSVYQHYKHEVFNDKNIKTVENIANLLSCGIITKNLAESGIIGSLKVATNFIMGLNPSVTITR